MDLFACSPVVRRPFSSAGPPQVPPAFSFACLPCSTHARPVNWGGVNEPQSTRRQPREAVNWAVARRQRVCARPCGYWGAQGSGARLASQFDLSQLLLASCGGRMLRWSSLGCDGDIAGGGRHDAWTRASRHDWALASSPLF